MRQETQWGQVLGTGPIREKAQCHVLISAHGYGALSDALSRWTSPNKSQTTVITVIWNVMSWKEGFSRAWIGEFLAVFCHCGAEARVFTLQRQSFPGRRALALPTVQVFRFGESLRRERARRRAAGESRRRAL